MTETAQLTDPAELTAATDPGNLVWTVPENTGEASRAVGHDVTPGHDELHHYWTKGDGLARWINSTHQFTTLRDQLVEEAHVTPEVADRWAAAWVHEVTGFWPGSDMHRVLQGGKPRGKRIGPG